MSRCLYKIYGEEKEMVDIKVHSFPTLHTDDTLGTIITYKFLPKIKKNCLHLLVRK